MSSEKRKALEFLTETLQAIKEDTDSEKDDKWYQLGVAATFVASAYGNVSLADTISVLLREDYSAESDLKVLQLASRIHRFAKHVSSVGDLSSYT